MGEYNKDINSASSWNEIYLEGDAGWDIGRPSPPFEALLKRGAEWLKTGSLINFGAGAGHDAKLFADAGFDVTAIDFAEEAIKLCNAKGLKAEAADLFELDAFANSFDYVLEHTCYCAIDRSRLAEYRDSAHKVLKSGGVLFGLFYRFDDENDAKGPPFWTSEDDIRKVFAEKFEILEMTVPEESLKKRKGRERLIAMRAL